MSLAEAIAARDVSRLPSRRDEDWRWTDLRGLVRELPPSSPPYAGEAGAGPFDGFSEDRRLVLNGLGDHAIHVPAGQTRSVVVRFLSRNAGAHAARLTVEVGEGARLRLFESYEGDDGDYVAHAGIAFTLAANSAVERLILAADGPNGVSVSQAEVELSASSEFSQSVFTTGARRQRLETRVSHPGGGARLRLDGAYLLNGQRHADITTVVSHRALDGATSQLTKGVVRDQARGVFQGRIVVEPGADRTDARMGHHALILSERAEVDARPELLIYADDVQCAHGNTVGALDEDVLFYIQSRGVPEAEARALLTGAFVGEVIDRVPDEAVREAVRALLAEPLGGG